MQITDLAGADVVLLGIGVETLTVLPHLRQAHVGRVQMVETATPKPEQARTLAESGIGPDELLDEVPKSADVVLRSPGYPANRDDVVRLSNAAHVATTPTGLWLAVRGGKGTVAVTGTKGKSSTATLIATGLEQTGVDTTLVGNIGTSAWLVDPYTEGVAIVELSSYQGADLLATGEVVVLTLLTDDHLDWHGSAEAYRTDKLHVLAANQADGTPPAYRFAPTGLELPGPLDRRVTRVDADGDYQARNVALAAAAIRAELTLQGVGPVPEVADLTARLSAKYPHLQSRFDVVTRRNDVTWIDDALASNPSASAAALERLAPGPVVLVCGGHDRGVRLDPVVAALDSLPPGSVTILWLGNADDHRFRTLATHAAAATAQAVDSMGEAVSAADRCARPGTSVIFSPLAPTERAEGVWSDRSARFRAAIASLPNPY